MKTAIILTAGKGSKIWPYGVTKNKAVLPIANRPVISWTVDALRSAGVERFHVVTGHRQEQITHAVAGMSGISFHAQTGGWGTVPALLSAWDLAQEDQIVVVYGDVLVAQEDIQNLVKNHKESGSIATALLQPLGSEPPNDWLCAQLNGERIAYVLGHPRDNVTHRFCGAFVFDKRFLPYLQGNPGIMHSVQVGMMPADEAHIEESIQIAIEDHQEIRAVEAKYPFIDLDKPWHLLEGNTAWLRYQSSKLTKNQIGKNAKISGSATINGRVVIGEDSEIGAGVIVEGDLWVGANTQIVQGAIIEPNVSIGSNCLIRRYCQIETGTSVGDRCVVGHCAEVSGIMMRMVYAYHYGEYWGVLGEASDLGAATVCGNLRFDDMQTAHRIKGRREIPRSGANAAYLGDYVRTGVNAIIMPGVKVGPYSILGAGAIVEEDVPDRTLLYVKQEQIRKSWGPERYGW